MHLIYYEPFPSFYAQPKLPGAWGSTKIRKFADEAGR